MAQALVISSQDVAMIIVALSLIEALGFVKELYIQLTKSEP